MSQCAGKTILFLQVWLETKRCFAAHHALAERLCGLFAALPGSVDSIRGDYADEPATPDSEELVFTALK